MHFIQSTKITYPLNRVHAWNSAVILSWYPCSVNFKITLQADFPLNAAWIWALHTFHRNAPEFGDDDEVIVEGSRATPCCCFRVLCTSCINDKEYWLQDKSNLLVGCLLDFFFFEASYAAWLLKRMLRKDSEESRRKVKELWLHKLLLFYHGYYILWLFSKQTAGVCVSFCGLNKLFNFNKTK